MEIAFSEKCYFVVYRIGICSDVRISARGNVLRQVIEFLVLKVEYPITVNCDNAGAIFLAGNASGQRNKHVNICYHYIREYVEDGTVKVVFVKSSDNEADLFTKNLNEQATKKHVSKFMEDVEEKDDGHRN